MDMIAQSYDPFLTLICELFKKINIIHTIAEITYMNFCDVDNRDW
jgi:hypothetical protein